MTSQHCAFIAVGSNLGFNGKAPQATVLKAFSEIETACKKPVEKSKLFQTPAFPAGNGPDFVNAVLKIQWETESTDLLEILHQIEASFDRRREKRWGPRSLDLDLLAHGDHVLPDRDGFLRWAELSPAQQQVETPDTLVLPHPRIQDRAFVLVPWMDIAPDWKHPVMGQTVRQMVDQLDPADVAAVRALA